MAPVSRKGRILDLVGLLLVVGGGAILIRAWIGFEGVRHYQASVNDAPWAATRLANGFLRLQHVGAGVMLAGIAVFVGAWWIAGRGAKRMDASGDVEVTDGKTSRLT